MIWRLPHLHCYLVLLLLQVNVPSYVFKIVIIFLTAFFFFGYSVESSYQNCMVSFGKRYFVLSFDHTAFLSCGLWMDCSFYFLFTWCNNSGIGTERCFWFFVVFGVCLFCFYVLSCFVRRQCWASCPTELTMGVSRHL